MVSPRGVGWVNKRNCQGWVAPHPPPVHTHARARHSRAHAGTPPRRASHAGLDSNHTQTRRGHTPTVLVAPSAQRVPIGAAAHNHELVDWPRRASAPPNASNASGLQQRTCGRVGGEGRGGGGSSCELMLVVVAFLNWFFVVGCFFLSLPFVLDGLCVRFLWCSLLLFVIGFSFWVFAICV